MLQLLQGFLLLRYFHFRPRSAREGTCVEWGPERCLHHCHELVRTGEPSATLGSLFPFPQTDTGSWNHDIFQGFLHRNLVSHVISLRVGASMIKLTLLQWKLNLFHRLGQWFWSEGCALWKSLLSLSPQHSLLGLKLRVLSLADLGLGPWLLHLLAVKL